MSWLPSNEQYFAKKDRYYRWLTGRAMAGERWMLPTYSEMQELLKRSNLWDEDVNAEEDQSQQPTGQPQQPSDQSHQPPAQPAQPQKPTGQPQQPPTLDPLLEIPVTRPRGSPTSPSSATSFETPEQVSKRRFNAMLADIKHKSLSINEQDLWDEWSKADEKERKTMEATWSAMPSAV